MDQLLLALWADPACKTSLVALAKDSASARAVAADASGGVLVDYARAVLNDLMYLLKVGRGADARATLSNSKTCLSRPRTLVISES